MQPLTHIAKALWIQNGQNMTYYLIMSLHRRCGISCDASFDLVDESVHET